MKRISRSPILWLFALLLPLSALPARADVSALISSPGTSLDQPFRLTLKMEGEQTQAPDLSVLETDFEILGRATQQSVTIINGKMSSQRSLVLTLLPKRAGKLTIPPIAFGDQQTRPLTIEVTPQAADSPAATSQALIELSLDKQQAYPQEAVLLTLKLYLADGVRGEQLDEPKTTPGDTRLTLLDESNTRAERDGVAYRVLERTYALFAYQPGTLQIEPVGFRGRSGGQFFGLLDDPFRGKPQGSRAIVARSKPLTLEIRPIPPAFSGEHWLPARNLQLVDTGLDSGQPIVAGKPVTRRIMLVADGLMSSQLPAIEQQVPDGIKPYAERPQLKDTPGRTGISGSRQSVITLIPTQAGRYTLPAVEIPWWNTDSDRQEVARLPAVSLQVLPGQTPARLTEPAAQDAAPADIADGDQTVETSTPAAVTNGEPHWLIWLLATAWLTTLFAWWFSRRRRDTAGASDTDAAKLNDPAPPAPSASGEILEQLRQAYTRRDAAAARESWLNWARLQWPENPPNNLTRLAGRCPETVSAAVIALDKAIYSPGGGTGWADFDPASLERRAAGKISTQRDGVPEKLQPLNP
ncbi:MAG: BatD family protein [Candidatus Thiodiazotropha sp.]